MLANKSTFGESSFRSEIVASSLEVIERNAAKMERFNLRSYPKSLKFQHDVNCIRTKSCQSTEHAPVNATEISFYRLWLVWKSSCQKRRLGDFFGFWVLENICALNMYIYSRIWDTTGYNYCISKIKFSAWGESCGREVLPVSSLLSEFRLCYFHDDLSPQLGHYMSH